MKIGFIDYEDPDVVPTTQELLATLTSGQKLGILNSFALYKGISYVKHTFNIRRDVVLYFYIKINDIETIARDIMQNAIPPTNNVELATQVEVIDDSGFNLAQIQLIINKMIQYSKSDGSGNWLYYVSKIIQ